MNFALLSVQAMCPAFAYSTNVACANRPLTLCLLNVLLAVCDNYWETVVHRIFEGRIFQDTSASHVNRFGAHIFHHGIGCGKWWIDFSHIVFQYLCDSRPSSGSQIT